MMSQFTSDNRNRSQSAVTRPLMARQAIVIDVNFQRRYVSRGNSHIIARYRANIRKISKTLVSVSEFAARIWAIYCQHRLPICRSRSSATVITHNYCAVIGLLSRYQPVFVKFRIFIGVRILIICWQYQCRICNVADCSAASGYNVIPFNIVLAPIIWRLLILQLRSRSWPMKETPLSINICRNNIQLRSSH